VRFATKTSASSIKRTAFQFLATLKFRVRFSSTSSGLVPISVVVRTISGLSRKLAIHSGLSVSLIGTVILDEGRAYQL